MAITPQGDIFNPYGTPPEYTVAISGSKVRGAKTWRYCPYSTQITDYNQNAEVPTPEKVYHQETNGRMHTYSLGGGYLGWVCADNDCPFYDGTATTEVTQHGRRFVPASGTTSCATDLPTLSGSVDDYQSGRKIVSGTRYFQI
jgi:hypothetical protein